MTALPKLEPRAFAPEGPQPLVREIAPAATYPVAALGPLRAAVEACPFHFKGEPLVITFSAGLAEFRGQDSAETVFERADQALYRAKAGGRNRIELG